MSGAILPQDRALIEQVRKVNKTLSLFVFALQERSNISPESQIGIADMLVDLADTVRERPSPGSVIHLAAPRQHQGVQGNPSSHK
ncbi:MAG: hypothetical protein ACJ72N_00995 [Labedaea sp.]